MAFAATLSRASLGMEAPLVRVEAHVSGGLPAFGIVGLPETAVRESRDRVRGAIYNSDFEFPSGRISVNLAPADLPKAGGRFDLPIALAILAASRQLKAATIAELEVLGELSLGGSVRPVRGVLLAAQAAAAAGRPLIVPAVNGAEAALPRAGRVWSATRLTEVVDHLAGRTPLPPAEDGETPASVSRHGRLEAVHGHEGPKRALVVAAAGGHNLLMSGPPGTGKTLLARCLPALLPPLAREEALEVAAIHSLAGKLATGSLPERPFRAPHHSATGAALVGGGSDPRPGEISLAHHGVLFLDELPEFSRSVLETLREPLESGEIAITRARGRATYPAAFQLVSAMNPCPAGRDCRGQATCVCPPDAARRYRARLSAPLLDRIDLHVDVPAVPVEVLASEARGRRTGDDDEHEAATARVALARERAYARQGSVNARLSPTATEQHCQLDPEGLALLERAAERMGLSARAWHRCLRVARTLADLEGTTRTERHHVAEALVYRDAALAGADAA